VEEREAKQELEYIKKIMQDSRKIILDDGRGFIFWGVLIIVGLSVTYFSVIYKWHPPVLNYLWPFLIGFGWIYTLIIEFNRMKRARVKTFAGQILGTLWFSVGVSATIFGFVGSMSGAYDGVYISAVISVVLGIAYALSGVLYGKKWISLLAFGWWIGAITIFLWPTVHSILIMILMLTFFQTLPGIIIYRDLKKLRSELV